MTLQELAKTLTTEQRKQAELCVTAEELLELARKENLPLTEELAQEAIRLLHPPVGKLSDSELDVVAGGAANCDSVCQDNKDCPEPTPMVILENRWHPIHR